MFSAVHLRRVYALRASLQHAWKPRLHDSGNFIENWEMDEACELARTLGL